MPKRSITLKNPNNLLLWLNLNKYPLFNTLVLKAVTHSFDKDILNTIQKDVYRTNIPNNLLDLIKLQTSKISTKEVSTLLDLMSDSIESSATLHKKEYDQAITYALESIGSMLKTNFISTFIGSLEKPLENLNLWDEDDIFLMEEDLIAILINLVENKVSKILKTLLAEEKTDIRKQLKEVFDIDTIKSSIGSFFENFQVGDLFTELYEIERNKTILDKQDFYLYFCDIAFSKAKYPIFYIPFSINKQNNSLEIEFDSQVYINKKAIEYISQEYNQEKNKKWNINAIAERIIYLAQHKNDFKEIINIILWEMSDFFELDKKIDIEDLNHQTAKSSSVRISNSCYITLFDKSDEALVNDYEEILQLLNTWDNILATAFNKLIDDFIYNEPETCAIEIHENRDNQEVQDKLVFQSPIPLNQEQLQILSAIKKDDCKYIIVQWPPWTGKSHTITAVVFDAILKNQSVLVLSDKKEALDVVEDKITETMNKVRVDDNFQNPVLRLGKTGNAYAKILSNASISSITNNYLAVKKKHSDLSANILTSENSLKEDIELEALTYKEIDMLEVYEFFSLDKYYEDKESFVDFSETSRWMDSSIELEEFRKIFLSLQIIFLNEKEEDFDKTKLFQLLDFSIDEFQDILNFQKYLWLLKFLCTVIDKLKNEYGNELEIISEFKKFKDKDFKKLDEIWEQYENEKNFIFWYLFKKEKIWELNKILLKEFWFTVTKDPHENLRILKDIFNIFNFANELKNGAEENKLIKFDYLKFIYETLNDEKVIISLNKLLHLVDDLEFLKENLKKYPITLKKAHIDLNYFKTFCENTFTQTDDTDFNRLMRYIGLKDKIEKQFSAVPSFNYWEEKKNIENLLTVQMTHIMDGRLVNFRNKYQSTATALKKIIQNKMKFPRDEFSKLKEAFPCILAGIRDYAEYIPLEPEAFDLVIIDEASQVSVSQAFPALLRAKKVLILWDKKQFSNVKTAQARGEENRKYLIQLKDCFTKTVSNDTIKLQKLDKFNIKASILDFFEYISNYNTQLRKYFRGYKEIISYSNKYFYQDNLQVMKIRWKLIDDVLKFSIIEHDWKSETIPNTNTLEVEFIIAELKKLKENESNGTIGIITPHTNQQKLLVEMINKLPEKDHYYDKLKLKIMTFDTCQGEERDTIYYSMVATKTDDHLWGVFIKDLSNVDIEEDWQIKAQRLNVWFSRAKECMHFIMSKSIEEYDGSIWEAMRHYFATLQDAKKESSITDVDQNSQMEPEVLNRFYQTDFWKKNIDNIEFKPQFELGKYLKQLDTAYTHPKYKVDFLLIYRDELYKEHKIIIEYDWFKEHFKNAEWIDQHNYQSYYSEEDVYREKVLESYWYKFLRINKFNISNNPVSTLNSRILSLIKNTKNNIIIDQIHHTINGLENWDMKECPKCKEIRNLSDFMDESLRSKHWRFCSFCKNHKVQLQKSEGQDKKEVNFADNINCPRCWSKMILRHWRYGKFYGCSKFPYCKWTRQS